MSRAPLVLSAAAIFCASSFLALADAQSVISNAATRDANISSQKFAAKQRLHDYGVRPHYRGYDDAPSAMIVSSHAS
jgi:hypothetical protein